MMIAKTPSCWGSLKRLFVVAMMAMPLGYVATAVNAVAPAPTPATTITLNESDPHLGGTVTFTCTNLPKVPGNTGGVRIQILAYQDGALIYGTAGSHDESFLLGGSWSQWMEKGGPAHCVADLYYWSYKGGHQSFHWLATTTFDAAGAAP